MTLIGNKEYDEDALNRITIVRLTQKKIPQSEIRKLLGVSKALVQNGPIMIKESQKQWVGLLNLQMNKKILFIKLLKVK